MKNMSILFCLTMCCAFVVLALPTDILAASGQWLLKYLFGYRCQAMTCMGLGV